MKVLPRTEWILAINIDFHAINIIFLFVPMDCFAPQQFGRFRRGLRFDVLKLRFPTEQEEEERKARLARLRRKASPNPHHTSARRAFWALGLCNIPAFSLFQSISIRTNLRLIQEWTIWEKSTWLGHLTGSFLSSIGHRGLSIRRQVQSAQRPWLQLLALTPQSLSSGKIWTLLTSAFVHRDVGHFFNNMAALWTISYPCADVPGMDMKAVSSIAALSAITGSVVELLEWHFQPATLSNRFGMGASGIVCAFQAVAVLRWLQDFRDREVEFESVFSVDGGLLAWSLVSQINNDWTGFLSSIYPKDATPVAGALLERELVGHSVHLAGAFVGAVYYLVVLRPRSGRSDGALNDGESSLSSSERIAEDIGVLTSPEEHD